MSVIEAGRSYRIKNVNSGYYLNVKSNSTETGARLEQWPMEDGGAKHDAKVWHVFPLDYGAYLFANKNSGFIMKIVDNSTEQTEPVEQYRKLQSPSTAPSQTWLLEHVSDDTYRVRNQKSNHLMNIYGYSKEKGEWVEQHKDTNNPSGAKSQQWVFEVEDEFERVLNLPTFEDVGIGDIHRMTDFAPTDSDTTDPVEIANFAYPFPFITDQSYNRQRQGRENPYYILRRYGYWKRVYYYEHGGASQHEKKETTYVGLSSRNSTEVEETTSTSVSSEASFGFKGFGSSISTTFAHQMKVTTTSEDITESWVEKTITRTYGPGIRVAEAIWYREDKYVLERLDGTTVMEWTVCDDKVAISDAWPEQAAEELEQYRSRLT
ncbi:RICIN domain-containing protein [Sphaerisporangium sp. NPDC051011]|uniref:RICIN domain-containing protein n=1 Tax=Sphaerisporangium sp. NPDC051011 TaxID=3155792 RepID=UPI0033EEF619